MFDRVWPRWIVALVSILENIMTDQCCNALSIRQRWFLRQKFSYHCNIGASSLFVIIDFSKFIEKNSNFVGNEKKKFSINWTVDKKSRKQKNPYKKCCPRISGSIVLIIVQGPIGARIFGS